MEFAIVYLVSLHLSQPTSIPRIRGYFFIAALWPHGVPSTSSRVHAGLELAYSRWAYLSDCLAALLPCCLAAPGADRGYSGCSVQGHTYGWGGTCNYDLHGRSW